MMKKIFVAVDLVLLTAIAYIAVNGFYFTFDRNPSAARTPGKVSQPSPSDEHRAPPPLSDYRAIIDRDLFKAGGTFNGNPRKIDTDSLEKTALNLVLLGTVVSDDGPSYAVIEQKDSKNQGLYREGDEVAGAEVKIILKERVVLRVGARDEILLMEKQGEGQNPARRAVDSARRSAPRIYKGPAGNQRIVLNRGEIDDAVANVNELMTQARISPHFKPGQSEPDGLSVSAVKAGSIFRKMGLRDGDIIKGVDGRRIETLDDALSLYSHLRTSDNVKLNVIRRGEEIDLDYVIE